MPKPFDVEREGPQHLGAHDLVAGLHVGQHRVVEHVGDQRQQPVARVVREHEHAVPADEPRSVDDVGAALADQLDEIGKLLRRVLQVGVLNDDEVAV